MSTRRFARNRDAGRRRLRFESLEDRRVMSLTVGPPPVVTNDVIIVSPKDEPLSSYSDGEIPFLEWPQFPGIEPRQVPLLSAAQIATIPGSGALDMWPVANRRELLPTQVLALNIGPVRIYSLDPDVSPRLPQISYLSPTQITRVVFEDFWRLLPSQVPLLTPAQIATIPGSSSLDLWPVANRRELLPTQVVALNIGPVRIYSLDPPATPRLLQISYLSPAQIERVIYEDFPRLLPTQVPHLTPNQIATIPSNASLDQWSAANLAALLPTQVQALNIGPIRIYPFYPAGQERMIQISYLSVTQIGRVEAQDFYRLNAGQVQHLTAAQFGGVTHDFHLRRAEFTAAHKDALTQPQIQALQINGAVVRIDWIPAAKLVWLTQPQVEQVIFGDFHKLPVSKIPFLTPAQIATVQNDFTLGVQLSVEQRGALTQPQVQALAVDKTRIGWLTPAQRAWITPTQVPSVIMQDFEYLNEVQTPHLTDNQVLQITDSFLFSKWSDAARHALDQGQVQLLNMAVLNLDLLSPTQRGWLTPAQVRTIIMRDFFLLPVSQIQHLSEDQIRSIIPGQWAQWSPAQRAALTLDQLHVINVRELSLEDFTPAQIDLLLPTQIASLKELDISRLHDHQIPLVTPGQFAQMTTMFVISGWNDDVRSKLTQAQLMALPFNLLANYMSTEHPQYPPALESYHPVVHQVPGPDGLVTSHDSFMADADRLTRTTEATHRAVNSGAWNSTTTWQGGLIPGAGAKVYIQPGVAVTFNAQMTETIKTLRIEGTLTFATNADTTLRVDTIYVHHLGKLHIGTATNPIGENVTARVIIPAPAAIDRVWDPRSVSRGLLGRGETRMFGRTVTPFVELQTDPMAGTRTLQLASPPVGWRPGDVLALAGTSPVLGAGHPPNFGSERAIIESIDGTNVTLVSALLYNHDAPDNRGLSVHVANLTRNIQFSTEFPLGVDPLGAGTQWRPHIAFFDNPNVQIENVKVEGFGRTDKRAAINSAVVVANQLVPGTGTNPRARYAIHFHHTGVNPDVDPAIVRGNLVISSPGWGYVNHQSHVDMTNNVALDVIGAGFTGEDGNEIGVMRGNFVMNAIGNADFVLDRKENNDFGHGGHGFWFQGPGIIVEDNIVSGTRNGAYGYMTASSQALFDTVNLTDDSIAHGLLAVPIGVVPIRSFKGNTAYAVNQGLEIWFHNLNLNDAESVVENFTSWNTSLFGIQLPYTGHVTIKNSKLLGRLNAVSGYGIMSNRSTHDITFQNVHVEGFEAGIIAPLRRATVIEGGYLSNITNLLIGKAHSTIRSLRVNTPIQFVPLSFEQLGDRETLNVALSKTSLITEERDRKAESFYSADDLLMNLSDGTQLRLYFDEQAAGFTPFPTAPSSEIMGFDEDHIGKTNQQLQQLDNMSFNGGFLPAGAFTPNMFYGKAVVVSTTPPPAGRGDFDGDNDVDGGDFLTWQRHLGLTAATAAQGDADGDRDVDAADLAFWDETFGTPPPTGGTNGALAAAEAELAVAVMAPPAAPATTVDATANFTVLVDAAMAADQLTYATRPAPRRRWSPPRR